MPAYLVAGNDVIDVELMRKYVEGAGATLGEYGVKLLAPDFSQLVEGGPVVHKEGDFRPSRVVILEFPDMERALAWYDSPAYQAIIGLRQQGSVGSLFFVEGAPEA